MKYFLKTLIVVLTVSIICCMVYVGYYFYQYSKTDTAFNEIENTYVTDEEEETKADSSSTVSSKSKKAKVDIEALKKKYPAASGYIYQKNVLSYPIMQCDNNDYYLKHLPDGSSSISGSIFFEKSTTTDSRAILVFGHNMRNGAMFGCLKKFRDKDFFKKHKKFQLYIGRNSFEANAFCVFNTNAYSYVYDYFGANDKGLSFDDFVVKIKSAATCVNEDYVPGANDGLVLLSTCTNGDGRLVVALSIKDYVDVIENAGEMKYLYELN